MILRKYVPGLLFSLVSVWARAQTIPDWENPADFEHNQVETHVTLTPYASSAAALQDDQATSPWQQSLNGVWKFYWTEVLDQSPADFNLQHYSVADWPEIQVPGNWQI
jgi:beta-galactosidase